MFGCASCERILNHRGIGGPVRHAQERTGNRREELLRTGRATADGLNALLNRDRVTDVADCGPGEWSLCSGGRAGQLFESFGVAIEATEFLFPVQPVGEPADAFRGGSVSCE